MIEEFAYSHNISIENRKKTSISGVKEVIEFSSEIIELITSMGNLSIRGNDLKIEGFDAVGGELSVSGLIIALIYTTDSKKSSFLSKIFR